MILLAYRHGLRASEVCDLRWDQVDFNQATLHVRRVKAGTPSTHPLTGAELRALRRLHREAKSPVVFVSEHVRSPLQSSGFRRMIERAASGLEIQGPSAHAEARVRFQAGERRRALQGIRAQGREKGRILALNPRILPTLVHCPKRRHDRQMSADAFQQGVWHVALHRSR